MIEIIAGATATFTAFVGTTWLVNRLNRDAFNSIPVGFLTSPFDFILMLFEQPLPKLPTLEALNRGRDGNWHHSGKDWWTEAFRADAEWWSKLARFLVWWLAVLLLVVAL